MNKRKDGPASESGGLVSRLWGTLVLSRAIELTTACCSAICQCHGDFLGIRRAIRYTTAP